MSILRFFDARRFVVNRRHDERAKGQSDETDMDTNDRTLVGEAALSFIERWHWMKALSFTKLPFIPLRPFFCAPCLFDVGRNC